MVKEYEGKSEQEAIQLAMEDLGVGREALDVEVLQDQSGLFGLGKKVQIRVYVSDRFGEAPTREVLAHREHPEAASNNGTAQSPPTSGPALDPETDAEHGLLDFLTRVTEKMGHPSAPVIAYRDEDKLGIRLDGPHSAMIIGRKGKNIDALQVLANVVVNRLGEDGLRVVLDAENYRMRREESLIRLAEKVGDQVMRSRGSRLLEPMNPFERRLIHTTLNDVQGVSTRSEGEGLYKQVRVFWAGSGES